MRRTQPAVPSTLDEAHEVLWRRRPAAYADLARWAAYYRHSAEVYAQTAEVDLRHRHEAVQCAGLEMRKAQDIERQLNAAGGGT